MKSRAIQQQQVHISAYLRCLMLSQIHVLLLCAYASLGWVLCAYAVPQIIWVGTVFVTLHLSWVGIDAILLALIWVNFILTVGAIDQVWMWKMPIVSYFVVPLVLLLVWFLAIGIVLLVAITHQYLKRKLVSSSQRTVFLLGSSFAGLVCGVSFYQLFTLPRIQ
ncbi:hypothetical protein ACQ4M4_16660 [Leptolyngbya sp. AN02str]|uniref:hypothetical protein n=1 Tax=Leptolyngbya sp. AN02str TaxID=3423363 RepID=UPI003D31B82E